MLLCVVLNECYNVTDLLERQGIVRNSSGVAMSMDYETILQITLFDSLHLVVANAVEKVVRTFTKVMPMVHVCCYHFLSLSRFVSCVAGSKLIPVYCCHNGPKNHQIELFMGQK